MAQPLPDAIDIEVLVPALVPMMRVVAGDHILVTCRARALGYQLRCNVHALESSILSLVLNARDTLPDGGHIGISADLVWSHDNGSLPQARPHICVAVHNNGAQAGCQVSDFASVRSFVDVSEGRLDIQSADHGNAVLLYLPAIMAVDGA